MHFYEASIITTKDGLHFQVYGNEHPTSSILAKPKYIPCEKVGSDNLQCRFIAGRKMNRLNLWIKQEELKKYLEDFSRNYPHYIFKSNVHQGDRLFFGIPIDSIERIYSPKKGLSELMSINPRHLDPHLKLIYDFVKLLLNSGLKLEDLGITYSSLIGHYFSNISDVNIVVHGKENFWKLMDYLKTAEHSDLKWKTPEQWIDFHKKRNRYKIFTDSEFVNLMSRKKSEGYFRNSLFVIFGVEKQEETWFKWGQEHYYEQGLINVEGVIKDNFNSIVRPGFYEIENSKVIEGHEDVPVKKVVFYSRDYAMMGFPGEKIQAKGILEKVVPKTGEPYHRVVVGYFDSFINRRNQEFIKVFKNPDINECNFCQESKLQVGDTTNYGAKIIYKLGEGDNGWFATLSPKTAGNPEEDFSIQLMPISHVKFFSEINKKELASNYGIAFAKISWAVGQLLKEQGIENKVPISVYGKCKHEDEHIHIKIFPYRGDVAQPFTVDSSFIKKQVHKDDKGEFIKMKPIQKKLLSKEKFDELSNKLIGLLK